MLGGEQRGEVGNRQVHDVGEMPTGGLLGQEALGGVLRADVGLVDVQPRIALLEQGDVIARLLTAVGVHDHHAALTARALDEHALALARLDPRELRVHPFARRERGGLRGQQHGGGRSDDSLHGGGASRARRSRPTRAR
jgi:hypothetical protein